MRVGLSSALAQARQNAATIRKAIADGTADQTLLAGAAEDSLRALIAALEVINRIDSIPTRTETTAIHRRISFYPQSEIDQEIRRAALNIKLKLVPVTARQSAE